MNRRDFLKMTALGGLCASTASSFAQSAKTPNLRVGILSDIHVTRIGDHQWFEKALRHFDAVKVDAVLITGDLTTWNKRHEFEAVAKTWFQVFPGDRRSRAPGRRRAPSSSR